MEHVLISHARLTAPTSKRLVWIGRGLTGLIVAFLLFDGAIKLMPIAPVTSAFHRLGYDVDLAGRIGVLLLGCTALYAIPRTQVLGALLLTAYLGGATATHVRVGDPFWFPIALGVILWVALYLRAPRLRALLAAPSAS